MKIFFGFSDKALYKYQCEFSEIYKVVEELGYEIISEPIQERLNRQLAKNKNLQGLQNKTLLQVREAGIVILETTLQSLEIGYYINMALELDKPVILLHKAAAIPEIFEGIENERLQIVQYSLHDIQNVLGLALNYAQDFTDIRFNLFIPQELNSYLKWAAKNAHTLRSNFVRNLILEHKKEHREEYNSCLRM